MMYRSSWKKRRGSDEGSTPRGWIGVWDLVAKNCEIYDLRIHMLEELEKRKSALKLVRLYRSKEWSERRKQGGQS